MNESKANRNVIKICIQKPPTQPTNNTTDTTNNKASTPVLSYDDLVDFLFDKLQIRPEDCTNFNYSQYTYRSKVVGFKPTY